MNRGTLPTLACVVTVAALSTVALRATTVTQVHPLSGGTNAPVQIAILADAYSSTQQEEFNYDVENFIKYGLLADEFYEHHEASMRIVSYFDATPAGQESRFGFQLGAGDGNCAVKAAPDVLSQLQSAIGSALVTHFVVIGNHPYSIGCTSGNWSYVAVDAAGTDVLQHELGHLVGLLFDEWALPSNSTANHPGLISDQYNCAAHPPPPAYWMSNTTQYPGAQQLPACDLYQGSVVHAYEHCRMGAMNHREFCAVCRHAMERAFAYFDNPNGENPDPPGPQPQASHVMEPAARFGIRNAAFVTAAAEQPAPAPPQRVMRLLVDFDPGSRVPPVRTVSIVVRQRVFVTGAYVPMYRRAGEFLYEVTDNAGVREVGVVADRLFDSRAYSGSGPHATVPRSPAQMFLDVPNEDAATAADKSRNLKLIVYRIPRTVTAPTITRATWPALRKIHNFEKVSEVPLTPP